MASKCHNYETGLRFARLIMDLMRSPVPIRIDSYAQKRLGVSPITLRSYIRHMLEDPHLNPPTHPRFEVTGAGERRSIRMIRKDLGHAAGLFHLIALSFGVNLLRGIEGDQFSDAAQLTLDRAIQEFIRNHHKEKDKKLLAQLEKKFYSKQIGIKIYSEDKQDILWDIVEALVNDEEARLVYQSKNNYSIQVVQPLTLFLYNASFYLLAGKEGNTDKPRSYKLDRIISFERVGTYFQYPEDFDPKSIYNNALGIWALPETTEVQLLFSPQVASAALEKRWHPSQQSFIQSDQSLLVKMKISITPEFEAWLLSWGSSVLVQSPTSLRLRLLQQIQEMLHNYYVSETNYGQSGEMRLQ